MSDELKNIFDDFDPGADDSHVEKQWQAIKPFLPAEKKPKGIVLWSRRGRNRLLALAALLVLTAFVSIFIVKEAQPYKVAGHPATVTGKPSVTADHRGPAPDQRTARSAPQGTAPVNKARSPEPVPVGSKRVSTGPAPAKEQGIAAIEIQRKQESGNVQAAVLPVDTGSVVMEPLSEKDEQPATEVLFPKELKPAETATRDATTSFNEVKRPRSVIPSRITVEIFAGIDRYNNSTQGDHRGPVLFTANKSDASGPSSPNRGQTWVTGLAVHRSIGRRVFIPAQVVFSGAENVLTQEKKGSILVTNPVISSITGPDSTRTYKYYTETFRITTRSTVRAALGIGMRLFASPVFTVSAALSGEYSLVSYLRSNKVTFEETEHATPDPSIPTAHFAYNTSPGYEPDSETRLTGSGLGVAGGLHVARSLGKNLALTGRLTYHYTLQKNLLNGKYGMIMTRPRDLLLCFGLSYRMK